MLEDFACAQVYLNFGLQRQSTWNVHVAGLFKLRQTCGVSRGKHAAPGWPRIMDFNNPANSCIQASWSLFRGPNWRAAFPLNRWDLILTLFFGFKRKQSSFQSVVLALSISQTAWQLYGIHTNSMICLSDWIPVTELNKHVFSAEAQWNNSCLPTASPMLHFYSTA